MHMELEEKPSWLPGVEIIVLTLSAASMVEEVAAIPTRADVRLNLQYMVWFAAKKVGRKSKKVLCNPMALYGVHRFMVSFSSCPCFAHNAEAEYFV